MVDFWSEPTHTGGREEIEMSSGAEIPEIDLDELDGDLYRAWQKIQRGDYHSAECLVAKSWKNVHQFRISFDDRHLPATTDRDWRALLIKAWYWLRNLRALRCRSMGYWCEWVYPYGFVPEAWCPYHD